MTTTKLFCVPFASDVQPMVHERDVWDYKFIYSSKPKYPFFLWLAHVNFGPCLHFPNNSMSPSICLVCLPGSHSSLRFVDRTQLKCFNSFPWSPFKQNRSWWQPIMLKGLFFLLTRSWCSKLLLWHHSCWDTYRMSAYRRGSCGSTGRAWNKAMGSIPRVSRT